MWPDLQKNDYIPHFEMHIIQRSMHISTALHTIRELQGRVHGICNSSKFFKNGTTLKAVCLEWRNFSVERHQMMVTSTVPRLFCCHKINGCGNMTAWKSSNIEKCETCMVPFCKSGHKYLFNNVLMSVEVLAICPLLGTKEASISFIMTLSNAVVAILVNNSSTLSPTCE